MNKKELVKKGTLISIAFTIGMIVGITLSITFMAIECVVTKL